MYDIIEKKKRGIELSEAEIDFFVDGFTKGTIPDYQASALCMAVCLCGMTHNETAFLTNSMARSGDSLDLSCFGNLSADKHSTGGVGDKTTLVVAPVAAVLGCKVAKMSGRGLGHTGGTIDKLEAMGVNIALTSKQLINQTEKIGLAVSGQTGDLAPADKKLYALRDVTATVDSIPLIASSIMSKKLAAGAKNIVLDVKYGSGAFMKDIESARKLGDEMISIGRSCGRNVTAVLSDMDKPLGNYVGNLLEVKEAISVLDGSVRGELYEECVQLAANMAQLALNIEYDKAASAAAAAIDSGKAYEKFLEWMREQGGNVDWAENTSLIPKASVKYELICKKDGIVAHMDTEKVGLSAMLLGAGRESKESVIDFKAGLHLLAKTGDKVTQGDVLAELFCDDKQKIPASETMLQNAYEIF